MRALALAPLLLLACPTPKETAPPPSTTSPPTLRPSLPSDAMVQQWLAQMVLDHERVRPYLHTEVAANVPLKVHAAPDLALGAPQLQAAGQAVAVVDAAEQARFVLLGRERIPKEGAHVRVRFTIPPEGVVGHVDFELRDNQWRVTDVSVAER